MAEIKHSPRVTNYITEIDWPRVGKVQFCEVASRICYEDPNPDWHEISFAQGEVWLCDRRKISHGVVSGHRLMATHFWADPQTMQDPSKRLNQMVRDIPARHADGDQPAVALGGLVDA